MNPQNDLVCVIVIAFFLKYNNISSLVWIFFLDEGFGSSSFQKNLGCFFFIIISHIMIIIEFDGKHLSLNGNKICLKHYMANRYLQIIKKISNIHYLYIFFPF